MLTTSNCSFRFAVIPFALFLISANAFCLSDALGPNGINAYVVHQDGITGDGVRIGLLTAGSVLDSHLAFERPFGSVVTLHDFTDAALSRSNSHDTQMAAIMTSNGSATHPQQIGVAPGAKIHNGRIAADQISAAVITNALNELILRKHCRVIVTGIQLPGNRISADGNSIWSKIYDYYAENYDVIFANAAGNSHQQITVFGDAYNGITTAGLRKDREGNYRRCGLISNPGPTVDGRKKPDVAAGTEDLILPMGNGDDYWGTIDPNGRGLTSFSVPQTAGVAALLLEAAGKNPAENDDRSEVIKAVIINSTYPHLFKKDNSPANPFGSYSNWDSQTGYGRLDAAGAFQTLSAGAIVKDVPTLQTKGWAYDVMGSNAEHTYIITAKENQRLVLTVTWHRKLNKISPRAYFEAGGRFSVSLKIMTPSGRTPVFETGGRDNLVKTEYVFKEDAQYKIILKNPTYQENHDYGMAFMLIE